MFIRKITKKNKSSDKSYDYYRLTHSYRVGNKTRQQVILNLGTLAELPSYKHKLLADRIEELLTGSTSMFSQEDELIESLAERFAKQIIEKDTFPSQSTKEETDQEAEKEYTEVDLNSTEELESKDLGGEWLALQAFDRLNIDTILSSLGMVEKDIIMSKALLTAKMVHPSSELETERWLQENSATMELYGRRSAEASRYQLYKVADMLYSSKDYIEQQLYDVCQNMFSHRSKVVIFDLTNMHFEGMMGASKRAQFGRSKQKRSDCRLISLALTIDSLGFVRGSQFWDGNVSEPATLHPMLEYIDQQFEKEIEKPLLVFDAGLSTEENLDIVRGKYDYVCVSRSIPKAFTRLAEQATELHDNRGNKINVTKVENEKGETLLHVASEQKKKKAESMEQKTTQRFVERLNYLKEGLDKPRRTKKIAAVHEHIGKIKDQYSKVAKNYDFSYKEDTQKGIITDITWKLKPSKNKAEGHYFLRYSKKDLTETEIWEAYNLTREVEASFRCLKSDLNIRPVFHQKDKYIESHIWLGILAYQVVNYITTILKEHDIRYCWKTIVEKLKTQRITSLAMDVKGNKKAYIKTCTRPNNDVKLIYSALKFKDRPFVRKTKVVTQL